MVGSACLIAAGALLGGKKALDLRRTAQALGLMSAPLTTTVVKRRPRYSFPRLWPCALYWPGTCSMNSCCTRRAAWTAR